MAAILISESHPDVRRLLEQMVVRLGHKPVAATAPSPEQLRSADAFLVEPADPIGAVLAQAARLVDPTLPLISVSVAAPPPELEWLGVRFAAALVKPFTLEELRVAIGEALRSPRGGRAGGPPESSAFTDRGWAA
ncbi:MAG TPA: response regulator [Solirubrobacteraceae bacterium]|nr:response regulator [Solirubrobacteraceae bacterium]